MLSRATIHSYLHEVRVGRSSRIRDSAAVTLGVFVGCTPFYGFHWLLAIIFADIFRVNRLKLYLASNISNPIVLPILVFAEIQVGTWLRRGRFYPLSLEAVRELDPWLFGLELITGSLLIGVTLGMTLGGITYVSLGTIRSSAQFSELVDKTTNRYLSIGHVAWELANTKIKHDWVYQLAMMKNLLPGGDLLVDIGCGRGLMLALLTDVHNVYCASDNHKNNIRLPRYTRLLGIENRPKIARVASQALAGSGTDIIAGDISSVPIPKCSAVLLFDVLHMMSYDEQKHLLKRIRSSLSVNGVVLIREADAGAGRRFGLVRLGNRLKAIISGSPRQSFSFRRAEEWTVFFEEAGFLVSNCQAVAGNSFVNVLFRLSHPLADNAAL